MNKLSILGCLGIILLITLSTEAGKRTPEEWKSRIIYQVLTDRFSKSAAGAADPECTDLTTWCGGTWRGIIDQLDYITGLGANAIWISPIVLNVPDGYHGYWAKNIYEVEPHFGTEQDLKDLVSECHARDVWVMVDVVPNHMGYPHGCSWPEDPGKECDEIQLTNFTGLIPFDQEEHYHSLCPILDYENQTQVEYCRLANLPDLNQTVPEVRDALYNWIHNLTLLYDFDGYRVDTVKHIAEEFWGGYQEAADNFLLGECWNGDATYVGRYQNYMDSLFNFPSLLTSQGVFHYGESMTRMAESLTLQRQNFKDVSVLGILADNHDFPRFLHESPDVTLLKNSLVYVMVGEGIPVVYYGTEQGFDGGADPLCRASLWPHYNTSSDLYLYIQQLSTFHMENLDIMKTPQREIYWDDDVLVFSRDEDKVFGVMSKLGSGVDLEISVGGLAAWEGNEYTDLLSGTILSAFECSLNIPIVDGQPLVLVKTLNGTDIDPTQCPLNGATTFSGLSIMSAIGMAILQFLF